MRPVAIRNADCLRSRHERREAHAGRGAAGGRHFKWTPRGKRRIHAKPNWSEIGACRPWLDAELRAVKPDVLVALGATAAQALFGREFRVTKQRGVRVETDLAPSALATIHPSAILRADEADREAELSAFIDDLRAAARLITP